MRGTGRQSPIPCQHIPKACSHQGRGNNLIIDNGRIDDAFPHRGGDGKVKYQKGDEVEKGGPDYCHARRQHTRGHNRGNRVSRVVKTIDVVEYQRQKHQHEGEGKGCGHKKAVSRQWPVSAAGIDPCPGGPSCPFGLHPYRHAHLRVSLARQRPDRTISG